MLLNMVLLTILQNHCRELWWFLVQLVCSGKGQLGQAAGPCPVGFEYLQGWRLQNLSGQTFPMFDHLDSKKKRSLSYVSNSVFLFPLACDAELETTKK